jgi:hypothetical protein
MDCNIGKEGRVKRMRRDKRIMMMELIVQE